MRLPDFLVIGAKKAGTTSLYAWCAAHPEIYMSPIKETRFFSYEPGNPKHEREAAVSFPVRTLETYSRLFEGATDEKALGEASPGYLDSPTAPARIRETLPRVRLVVSLRHPVERAYSQYLMNRRGGREAVTSELADAFGPERPWVRASFYHDNLRRYFELFGSERVHVLLFDDLVASPRTVTRSLFEWLGVDPALAPAAVPHRNPGGVPRLRLLNELYRRYKYSPVLHRTARTVLPARLRALGSALRRRNLAPSPPLPAEVRARLLHHYRDDVLRLEELIGRDLSAWRDEDREAPRQPV